MRGLWRFLPVVGKALHLLCVEQKDARIADLEQQVTYWRTRCEKLTDAALVRAGMITAPMMETRPPIKGDGSQFGKIIAAMGVSEIDSTQQKHSQQKGAA